MESIKPTLNFFVIRVAPRVHRRGQARGTLIDSDVSPSSIDQNADFRAYYERTIGNGALPDHMVLEFGQPPTVDGKLEIKQGDILILLVGSDNPDGSLNERGIIGLAEVKNLFLNGEGASARCAIEARPILKLSQILDNQKIRDSRFFESSNIEDIRIFGFSRLPQAHNCVRFFRADESQEERLSRFQALLDMLEEVDAEAKTRLRNEQPNLAPLLAPRVELFDREEKGGEGTSGIAVENLESTSDRVIDPWDPLKIRVDPKMFSLKNIVDMIDDEDLELAPPFQRKEVWKATQKSRLIESILLHIPLPAFYFSAAENGSYQVVDGLQRLSTIYAFMKNRFRLESLEYLKLEAEGKCFSDFDNTLWIRRLKSTQIIVNVIDPQTPERVKFDIFRRINTGGSPLNAQEIRHCMSGNKSRQLLGELAQLSTFNGATSGVLFNHPRMIDREVILRFIAFKLMGNFKEYTDAGTMDAFLTQALRKIDSSLSDEDIGKLRISFSKAMENATRLFGAFAFRKWALGSDTLSPINRALFESWAVALSGYEWSQLEPSASVIVEKGRQLMTNDFEFIDSITTSTGDPRRVETRFSKVRDILNGLPL